MYTPSAQLVMHNQYRITYYTVKDHEKNEKMRKNKICFDNSINNHMNMTDNKKQIVWCRPHDSIREISVTQLNFPQQQQIY